MGFLWLSPEGLAPRDPDPLLSSGMADDPSEYGVELAGGLATYDSVGDKLTWKDGMRVASLAAVDLGGGKRGWQFTLDGTVPNPGTLNRLLVKVTFSSSSPAVYSAKTTLHNPSFPGLVTLYLVDGAGALVDPLTVFGAIGANFGIAFSVFPSGSSTGSSPAPPVVTAVNFAVDGNSNGTDYPPDGRAPADLLGYKWAQCGITTTGHTIAVSGATINDRFLAAPADLLPLFDATPGVTNIGYLIEIINSAATYAAAGGTDAANAALVMADLQAYCARVRSYGFLSKVFLGNHRGNATQPATNSIVDLVNAQIRATWSTFCDGFIENALDPRLADNSDHKYYQPGTETEAVATVANFGGLIRVATTLPHGWLTNAEVTIAGVVGAVEANGVWNITVLSPTTFNLQASPVASAYVSGGTASFDEDVHYNYVGQEVMTTLAMKEARASMGIAFHPGMNPACEYATASWIFARVFGSGGIPIVDGAEVRETLGWGAQVGGGGARATAPLGDGFIWRQNELGPNKSSFESDGTKYLVMPPCSRLAVVHAAYCSVGAGIVAAETIVAGIISLLSPSAAPSTYVTDAGVTIASAYAATDPAWGESVTPVFLFHQYNGSHATEELQLNGTDVPKSTWGGFNGDPSIANLTVTAYQGLSAALAAASAGDYYFYYLGACELLQDERDDLEQFCIAGVG